MILSQVSTANKAIREALRKAQEGIGSTIKFDNTISGTQIALFSPILATRGEHLGNSTRIMVIISDPNNSMKGELGSFASLYGLTVAETRILKYLLQQQSTHGIAQTLHISIHTLRTHLKALFAKTCTKNQRELVNFCRSHPIIDA